MKFALFSLLFISPHAQANFSPPEWKPIQRNLLQKCLGASLPLQVDRQVAYVQLPIGTVSNPKPAWFLLDTGATYSTIDAQFLYPPAMPREENVVVAAPSKEYVPQTFEFFGKWFKSNFSIQDYSRIFSRVKQAGIIGTDFLSLQPYILDYAEEKLYRSEGSLACSGEVLRAAGLTALSTQGYYSTQGSTVSISPEFRAPNVPTVPIKIGSQKFIAQIDSGYDDFRHNFSININPALKKVLDDSGVGLIPVPRLNSTLTTCVPGSKDVVTAYRLAENAHFSFVDIEGKEVSPYPDVKIFLKSTPPEAIKCGGISTWELPAAQLGSSFLKNAGFVILDPLTSKVWIPQTE